MQKYRRDKSKDIYCSYFVLIWG